MQYVLQKVGGAISTVALIVFAALIVVKDIELNVLSWAIWTTLDVLLVIAGRQAFLKEGRNEWPWLPICWSVGAAIITIVLTFKGTWQWTPLETLTAVLVAIAMIIWKGSGNPRLGIVGLTMAMTLAGIPSVVVAWRNHDNSGWWMWGAVALSTFITIVSAKKWSIEDRFLPVSSCIFNSLMTVLVLL